MTAQTSRVCIVSVVLPWLKQMFATCSAVECVLCLGRPAGMSRSSHPHPGCGQKVMHNDINMLRN